MFPGQMKYKHIRKSSPDCKSEEFKDPQTQAIVKLLTERHSENFECTPGVITHAFNPSTWEAEREGSV